MICLFGMLNEEACLQMISAICCVSNEIHFAIFTLGTGVS